MIQINDSRNGGLAAEINIRAATHAACIPFIREQIVTAWRNAIEAGKNPTAAAVADWIKKRLEAKVVTSKQEASAPVRPHPQPRKRATAESVGLKRNAEAECYMNWTGWQKTRGR